MSIDIAQFYQVFFEEAAEHLATMESLLLGLDVNDPSLDDLNAIFRSAHSIKGGSGTFGFNDMTEVTHILENLLDRLRKQELQLTDEMVNVFLEAGDVIRMQLDAHRGEASVDQAEVVAVCEKLAHLTAASGNAALQKTAAAPTISPLPSPVLEESADYGFFDDEPAKPETDDYGFFGDEPAQQADEGYGFFADAPVAASPSAAKVQDGAGFGFFDDEPTVESYVAAVQELIVPDKDPGFGLFVDEPTQLPTTPQQAQQESQQGYGFFQKIALKQEAPSQTADKPAAEMVHNRRSTDRQPAAVAETSIRVNVEKVDHLINLVGELVITQAMLAQAAQGMDAPISEKLQEGLHQLERNTRDLQEVIMSVRMLPISFVFSRFPRVVRDLASKLGKQVELKTLGEGTELDKGLIEKIADPLTHLVRNSLDHGIESPEKRLAAGKPEKGTITLKASHQGGNIVIEVSDDGGGLNRKKILSKARERGLPVRDDMSDQEVWMLIFEAGFSTADVVSDVSGRGVGMDVVKRNIAAMGGRVEIESAEGMGTRISIRLPLTLAILDGLSVAVGEQTYIIPLGYIIESLLMAENDLRTVSGEGRLVHVRGEYLPLVVLHDLFSLPHENVRESSIVVIVEADGKKVALLVDELNGQHQVVIKSLESNFRKLPGISGATIMGDGKVALILDVAAIALTPTQQNRLA
ncbi:MAG: chemotaxis protein CheW [Gallionella sp.]|nr:chemotaxis protein CheW [Gallionella sp.]MDD4945766.1 chemotaxis protein CheW [Gallionella sp.]MDD5611808.1 chemotaxis protein CheW [Gallionella sp.]